MYYTYALFSAERAKAKGYEHGLFYIGKGCNERAWGHFRKELQTRTARVIQKYRDVGVYIIADFETEKEAHANEIYWIKRLGRINTSSGFLVNLTDGGEGASGMVVSETSRSKMNATCAANAKAKGKIARVCMHIKQNSNGTFSPRFKAPRIKGQKQSYLFIKNSLPFVEAWTAINKFFADNPKLKKSQIPFPPEMADR